MKDIEVGDVVHVKGVAAYQSVGGVGNHTAGVWLIEFGYGSRAAAPLSDIVHVEPRPLQVGDRVRWCKTSTPVFDLRAIVDGSIAVVRSEIGAYHAMHCIDSLERVE
ncbi:MAG: hypothetical protein GEV06_16595 [Luteitalea sp.]|nr:hypothetical protein [Luteitalea sp.]